MSKSLVKFLSFDAIRPKALARMERYREALGQSLAVGIYHKGELYLLAGNEDLLTRRYAIGSLTKTLTAHLILALRDEGKLELERGVDTYLTLPRGSYPTVIELLAHTAGYSHVTPFEITLPAWIRYVFVRKNRYGGCTSGRVLRSLRLRRRAKSTRYGYSDFPYAVLGLVAEQVTGKPIATLLEEFVCERLQMKHTAVGDSALLGEWNGTAAWEWSRENPYVASGGLVSTLEDMLHYLALQIECREPYIEDAQRPVPDVRPSARGDLPCLGWSTYERSHILWHLGHVGAYRSCMLYHKQRELGVVLLDSNGATGRTNLHHLAKILLGEMKINKIDFTKSAL